MANTALFWNEFSKLNSQLEGDQPSAEAMKQLLSCLEEIDQRLYYHLGSRDNGIDLILSAEGHADLMPVLDQLKATAPKIERWDVLAAFEGMLLFGQRNERVFPDTENGDVLYRMALNGDKLWIAREVNFSLVFPTEGGAANFLKKAAVENFHCEVSEYNGAEGYSFQAEVNMAIIPSHETITLIENRLEKLAEEFGGRNDGWGCFEVKA
jgi:Regulator of ribonuclease activity B